MKYYRPEELINGRPEDLISAVEAADIVGRSKSSIRAWVRDKKLTGYRADPEKSNSTLMVSTLDLIEFCGDNGIVLLKEKSDIFLTEGTSFRLSVTGSHYLEVFLSVNPDIQINYEKKMAAYKRPIRKRKLPFKTVKKKNKGMIQIHSNEWSELADKCYKQNIILIELLFAFEEVVAHIPEYIGKGDWEFLSMPLRFYEAHKAIQKAQALTHGDIGREEKIWAKNNPEEAEIEAEKERIQLAYYNEGRQHKMSLKDWKK